MGDVAEFIDAVKRVAAGGSALDPEVVALMLGRRRTQGPVDSLTPRERNVLASMAEGKSNQGIAEALVVTEAAVEKHVTNIFNYLRDPATWSRERQSMAARRSPRPTAVPIG